MKWCRPRSSSRILVEIINYYLATPEICGVCWVCWCLVEVEVEVLWLGWGAAGWWVVGSSVAWCVEDDES